MRIVYRSKMARNVLIVKMDRDITAKLQKKEKQKNKTWSLWYTEKKLKRKA